MSVKVGMERSTPTESRERKMKSCILIVLIIKSRLLIVEWCFQGHLDGGEWDQVYFFDLDDENKINSTVYRDQILLGPLKEFWEDLFYEIQEPVVIEDNALCTKRFAFRSDKSLELDFTSISQTLIISTL